MAGDGANDLLGLTLEPNVFIQNSKVGACDIQPGRRPRGEARVKLLREYQERAHLTVESGNRILDVSDAFTTESTASAENTGDDSTAGNEADYEGKES